MKTYTGSTDYTQENIELKKKIKELEEEVGMFKRSADIRLYRIESLEAKLKQNEFEIIAEGKIIIEEKAVWLNCDVLIGGIFIAFKLKKYKGKNIQIGVREVK